jgi:hypothetical protein
VPDGANVLSLGAAFRQPLCVRNNYGLSLDSTQKKYSTGQALCLRLGVDAWHRPTAENREAAQLATQTTSGKKLDPALKSWLDEVIIPALVTIYLADLKTQNRAKNLLASTESSEFPSDKDGEKI